MANHAKTRHQSKVQSTAVPPRPVTADTDEKFRRRIAEAAYYRALERGFVGGDPVRDWLEAEREVQQQLH